MANRLVTTDEYLVYNKKHVTLRNLSFQLLFGGDIRQSKFFRHNIPKDNFKENKRLHRLIIHLSLWIQLFLIFIQKLFRIFHYILDSLLNYHTTSDVNSAKHVTILGHLDSRIELDKEIERGDGRYYPALAIMASKLAYENQNFIKSVVNHYWKMEFKRFYNFYNAFQDTFETQAFILQEKTPENDMTVVAFRGTSPFTVEDWRTDLYLSWCKFKGMGKTHLGFMTALGLNKYYNDDDPLGDYHGCWPKEVEQDSNFPLAYYTIRGNLREIMKNNKNAKFIVTGHSLGGALAILFPAILAMHQEWEILDRLEAVYTYGQPRVGDEKFGRFVKRTLKEHKIKYYRFVYAYDVVPTLPWDNTYMLFKFMCFNHFGSSVHFNSLYHGQIVEEEAAKKKRTYGNQIETYLWAVADIAVFIAEFIVKRLNAVWELIRGFIIPYTAGPDFREGWLLILFRVVVGITFPGGANHGPQDYVNATRLASEDLFLHYSSSMDD